MKTRTTISFLSLTLFSISAASCVRCITDNNKDSFETAESTTITSRHFEVGSFTGVDCSSMVDVKIKQGSARSVELVAPTNHIDKFTVSVKKGVLHIDSKPGVKLNNPGHIEMSIVVPELDMVKTSGTGDIDLVGEFVTKDFNATTTGTGDIEAKQLNAASLNLESSGTGDISIAAVVSLSSVFAHTSGTGDIILSGSAEKAVYESSGTGDVEAFRMKAVNVEASTSGTGDIECYASDVFTGSASGTGDIEVKGNPARREVSTKHIRFSK